MGNLPIIFLHTVMHFLSLAQLHCFAKEVMKMLYPKPYVYIVVKT